MSFCTPSFSLLKLGKSPVQIGLTYSLKVIDTCMSNKEVAEPPLPPSPMYSTKGMLIDPEGVTTPRSIMYSFPSYCDTCWQNFTSFLVIAMHKATVNESKNIDKGFFEKIISWSCLDRNISLAMNLKSDIVNHFKLARTYLLTISISLAKNCWQFQ